MCYGEISLQLLYVLGLRVCLLQHFLDGLPRIPYSLGDKFACQPHLAERLDLNGWTHPRRHQDVQFARGRPPSKRRSVPSKLE